MLGFIFGTVCLGGLIALIAPHPYAFEGPRWGRHHRRGGGRRCAGGHHGKHSKHRGRRGRARAAAEVFKRKLRIDEDQEDVVDHALGDLRDELASLQETIVGQREQLAEAFSGDTIDDAAIAAAFDQQDEAVKKARRAALSALKQIHAVLDDDQRAAAVAWLSDGELGWSR